MLHLGAVPLSFQLFYSLSEEYFLFSLTPIDTHKTSSVMRSITGYNYRQVSSHDFTLAALFLALLPLLLGQCETEIGRNEVFEMYTIKLNFLSVMACHRRADTIRGNEIAHIS